jgi:hypothetical protein
MRRGGGAWELDMVRVRVGAMLAVLMKVCDGLETLVERGVLYIYTSLGVRSSTTTRRCQAPSRNQQVGGWV